MELIPVHLESDGLTNMQLFLHKRTEHIKRMFEDLFKSKLSVWRRVYKGKPLEEVREYPFHNASNLVVPIVAIHTDTLLARVMSAIFRTDPLFALKIIGANDDPEMESGKKALEDALVYFGMEPEQLDLYRVERAFFNEVIKYGHATAKSLWERFVYGQAIMSGDGTVASGMNKTIYEGPRPEKIPYEDFMVLPTAKTLQQADFKIHVLHLQQHQLEERAFLKIYDPSKVKSILASPDRTFPDQIKSEKLSDADLQPVVGFDFKEWDVYECWFDYWIENRKYKLVASYHPRTKNILRLVYDPFIDMSVFVDANLFVDDDLLYGFGFAEALGSFQEEISQKHNQRGDALTVANCNMLRVSPDSKLNAGYRIFPGCMIPGEEGEIETMQFGAPQTISIEDEKLALDLAERRVGVSQPAQGLGSGTMNKRGVYTAMGTMALIQDRNDRTSLNISDLRYAHAKLGRLLTYQYGMEATKDKFTCFGDTKATLIMKALQAFVNGTIAIPIGAANASVNREVEKQNDMLLSRTMMMHYQAIGQMLGAASSPMTPPEVKDYLIKAIKAADTLMTDVLRVFGKDEPERMVPEPNAKLAQQQQPNMGGAGGNTPMAQPSGGQGFPRVPQSPTGPAIPTSGKLQ